MVLRGIGDLVIPTPAPTLANIQQILLFTQRPARHHQIRGPLQGDDREMSGKPIEAFFKTLGRKMGFC
jgi:hypothetical protein